MPPSYRKITEYSVVGSAAALLGASRTPSTTWEGFAEEFDATGLGSFPAPLSSFFFLAEMVPVVASVLHPKRGSLLPKVLEDVGAALVTDTVLRGADALWLCATPDAGESAQELASRWIGKAGENGVFIMNLKGNTPIVAAPLVAFCRGI